MLRKLTSLAVLAGVSAYAVTLPRPAAEVAISTPDGGQELLSKYRGKIVILTFILST
jgi:hypothetical protein